jgi:hypothetical protein
VRVAVREADGARLLRKHVQQQQRDVAGAEASRHQALHVAAGAW